MLYQVHQLADHSRPGPPGLIEEAARLTPAIEDQGGTVFGVFGSLLGLASNHIYLVTFGENEISLPLADTFETISRSNFRPTIRPVEHVPASSPGVYVFRWFSVRPENVDEITELSGNAWPGFESSFDTRVQGLFTEAVTSPERMLLITWYRNLTVWEQSRHPPSGARENFLRRHQLTLSAHPIGTYLVGTESPTSLVAHS